MVIRATRTMVLRSAGLNMIVSTMLLYPTKSESCECLESCFSVIPEFVRASHDPLYVQST